MTEHLKDLRIRAPRATSHHLDKDDELELAEDVSELVRLCLASNTSLAPAAAAKLMSDASRDVRAELYSNCSVRCEIRVAMVLLDPDLLDERRSFQRP